MIRNLKKCPKCSRKISFSNFSRHLKSCNGRIKKVGKIKDEWKQDNGKYKCPYCGEEKQKHGIGYHIWIKHKNGKRPKYKYHRRKPAWNKGLTKENDIRVRKGAETFRERIKNGTIIPSFSGRSHSKETKKKLSEAMIKAHKEL